MSRNRRWLLFVAVFALASFLRFHNLRTTPPGLYIDEAMDGVNAQYAAASGQFKAYYPEDNGREGLYVNILAVLFKFRLLPDTAPWSVRVPAAIAGVLTVLGVYFLVAALWDNPAAHPVALLSAFFLATSFWHINFSRVGFRAILAPLCLTWAMYFLLRAIRGDKSRYCWAATAGICYGLGFYTYIAFRITPLLLVVLIAFFHKRPAFWKCGAAFAVVSFVVAAPLGWHYLRHPGDFLGRTAQISVLNSPDTMELVATNARDTALMFVLRGDTNLRHNVPGAPELFWPVGWLFLLGGVLGIAVLCKKDRRPLRFAIAFLFTWLILGALPEILSDEAIPHSLRALLMIVPATVLAAVGAAWAYSRLAARLGAGWMPPVAVCALAFVAWAGYWQYFLVWAADPALPDAFNQPAIEAAEEIAGLPATAEKYIVVYPKSVVNYGIPSSALPIMYFTHSFVPDATAQKCVNHIHYLLPAETDRIPSGARGDTIFVLR